MVSQEGKFSSSPKLSALEQGALVIKGYVRHLPDGAGVYRMIDKNSRVLYVGKAKALSKRVASYTRPQGQSLRIQRMIAATTSMEFLLTANEVEALLLENNLIKRYRPLYNVLLRDDKTHLELFIRKDHDFPQISRHRGAHKKPGKYFGPYASAAAVTHTQHLLERLFLIRNCSDQVFNTRKRPCLQYQIKRCSAPCVGYISLENYQENIKRAEAFLNGSAKSIHDDLEKEMQQAAIERDYERAASLRDRIRSLTQLLSEQDINGRIEGDADFIALASMNGQMAVQTIFYRGGRHNGNYVHYPKHERNMEEASFLTAFLGQLYQNIPPPQEIFISHEVEEKEVLCAALSQLAKKRVSIFIPQRGNKYKLMQSALQNAGAALGRKLSGDGVRRGLLDELGELAGCKRKVERVEVYDNSHLSGTNPVGAMIVAGENGFEKASYRSFNIRKGLSAEEAANLPVGDRPTSDDDYLMMREVMTRRFSRLIKEHQAKEQEQEQEQEEIEATQSLEFTTLPDIIMLDGGLGQLSAAREALSALDLKSLPYAPVMMAVAKGPDRNAGKERIFLNDQPPIDLPHDAPLLYLIQRLRDEAHRFAIGTQRKKRKLSDFENPLDAIEGIGLKRKKQLMLHFGSAREISGASVNDIQKISGFSASLAQKIYDHFHVKH